MKNQGTNKQSTAPDVESTHRLEISEKTTIGFDRNQVVKKTEEAILSIIDSLIRRELKEAESTFSGALLAICDVDYEKNKKKAIKLHTRYVAMCYLRETLSKNSNDDCNLQ